MLRALTDLEREVYEFIRQVGEVMAKDVPFKKAGAVPSLVRKGLVEVYKRPVSPMSRKRHKFLRAKGEADEG
ncbi:MAG: hypothetical protein OEW93_04545 [Candidatus Bathyarchaeota archaeon]|nr:hypothetical protein [Candidatus Bathyarchaeota archaeon]MDH5792661.1 hypothetical protein [Candidatus Bathyarchaeota archaeon]